MKVRLTESQLRDIIAKTINESMNEWDDVAAFPQGYAARKGNDWKKGTVDKFIKQSPELDPAGFQWFGDVLKHNGKKRPKSAPKPKIAKPEGMDDVTYLTSFVPKYNKRFANGVKVAREAFRGDEPEQYEPLDVSGFKDMSDEFAREFSDRYYITQYGTLYTSNGGDINGCHVSIPYFAPQTKRFQVNLRIYDENGKEMWHTCPGVVPLVRKVYGDKWAERLISIEKELLNKKTAPVSGDDVDF